MKIVPALALDRRKSRVGAVQSLVQLPIPEIHYAVS